MRACMRVHELMHTIAYMWGQMVVFQALVVSFHCVGPGD